MAVCYHFWRRVLAGAPSNNSSSNNNNNNNKRGSNGRRGHMTEGAHTALLYPGLWVCDSWLPKAVQQWGGSLAVAIASTSA